MLALLGLPVPADMDGRALTQIFKRARRTRTDRFLRAEPHPHDGVWRDLPAEESDPFAAHAALQQLAALGYVELPADGDTAKLAAGIERDRRQNLAQVLVSTGRIAEAVELLRGLLAENDHPDDRCRLALYLAGLGRFAEAEELISKVPTGNLASPLPQLILGQVRLAQGRLEEAQAMLEPLGRAEFPLSYLHTTLGKVYARRGLLTEAEDMFRRALERDDDNAEAHDHLGTILRRTGRFEDAVYEHMRSAALQHDRPGTHIHLGMALARTGQFDWAIRAFEVAVELAPDHLFARRSLMHLYRRVKGDDAKAREHFHHVMEFRRRAQDANTPAAEKN